MNDAAPERTVDPVASTYHAQSADSVLAQLDTDLNGLPQTEAQDRLQRYGHNQLPESRRAHPVLRFLSIFTTP